MKHLYLLLILITFRSLFAGDTTRVLAHDKTHLNWYGNFDRWTQFPASGTYERIWLNLTYGCPGTGCSDWDYTTKVYLRQHTGVNDSTLQQAPQFRANNQAPDSLLYAQDTTWVYSYNSTTQTTDSVPSASITLYLYQDSLNYQTPTDTLYVFPAGYYNYIFDQSGNIIDSLWVLQDTTLYQGYWPYWNVFEVIHNIELTRAITPYGSMLTNTWEFTWVEDVTDFAPLLKDSVDIRIVYEGWQDGFTMSLEFVMIEGTPPREAIAVVPLWTGGFAYGNTNNPLQNNLDARDIPVPSAATGGTRLRVLQTGHGFGGSDNCAEFCIKDHYVLVDQTLRFSSPVWRNVCGLNPIYPQGGTWLYDRAGWCPGEIVPPYIYELTPFITPGSTHSIDMDMDPYTNQGNNNASYNFGCALIHYAAPAFQTDAGIEDILTPSNDMRYARFNPSCGSARIRVRNGGIQNVTQMRFEYGISGSANVHTYTWTDPNGIPFLDTLQIVLPPFDASDPSGQNQFYVKITEVNGGADQYSDNDMLTSFFTPTPVYPDGVIISIRANTAASQTRVFVYDENQQPVFSRISYPANTLERDTVKLPAGCYQLVIHDSGKNGLSFFTFNNDGNGTARIQNVNTGAVLQNFNANFGTNIIHHFTVGYGVSAEAELPEPAVRMYPNPATDMLYIELENIADLNTRFQLLDISGRILKEISISGAEGNVSLQGIPAGMYLGVLEFGNMRIQQKVMVR